MLLAAIAHGQVDVWQPSAWWTRDPGTPVKSIRSRNSKFPLSDQGNAGKWRPLEAMTDEFAGDRLDDRKWIDHNPGWKGRQPGFFDPRNVAVSRGCLRLTSRLAAPPAELAHQGYHTFATAAVRSVGDVRYGYFEVRAKAMRSRASSAFWFYKATPVRHTEIDVFEIGGGAPEHAKRLYTTAHVFRSPEVNSHRAIGGLWEAECPLANAFHVYGLQWGAKEIRWYFDGVLIRRGPNVHWHQPLDLNFDSETMPDWFGLPKEGELPAHFVVDYVRAWKSTIVLQDERLQ